MSPASEFSGDPTNDVPTLPFRREEQRLRQRRLDHVRKFLRLGRFRITARAIAHLDARSETLAGTASVPIVPGPCSIVLTICLKVVSIPGASTVSNREL
jgi:hypothetical protein